MLLTNHVMTGAAIGLATANPLLAAPAAFVSHFVLDSTPHFGAKGANFKKPKWFMLAATDSVISLGVYWYLVSAYPQHFWLITTGMFFAALPDLFYVPEVFWGKRYDPPAMRAFHHKIQIELPRGIMIEFIWAYVIISALISLL